MFPFLKSDIQPLQSPFPSACDLVVVVGAMRSDKRKEIKNNLKKQVRKSVAVCKKI